MKNSFKKSERLTNKTIIETIFDKGKRIKHFPFLLYFLPHEFEDGQSLKIVISVPKRKIKKAVNRNRIRRQIKEVYRLNKHDLKANLIEQKKSLALFLIYTGKEKPNFILMEEKIKLILKELNKSYLGKPKGEK